MFYFVVPVFQIQIASSELSEVGEIGIFQSNLTYFYVDFILYGIFEARIENLG